MRLKLVIGSLIPLLVLLIFLLYPPPPVLSPLPDKFPLQRNLSKYSFQSLSKAKPTASQLYPLRKIAKEKLYASHIFHFQNSQNKKVSGIINIPDKISETRPVVILLRGYADKETYISGTGTKRAASFFAENGFITISPDFLGYADSDPESPDILESRFEKPSTVVSLIYSLRNQPVEISKDKIILKNSPFFIWAHSNGGQIAISVLEITREPIPTTLWAPVSIAFPDSILYYIDELDDKGAYLKKDLADFETRYDAVDFSISPLLTDITAPIQLHQGGKDKDVPKDWSDRLALKLNLNPNKNYFYYPQSDHNLRPDWQTAIDRDLSFFQKLARSKK